MNNFFKILLTIILGAFFGFVLIESQAISWYRIQEMFHFHSFHMFGLLGSAIFTASFSLFLIKKYQIKSLDKNKIILQKKPVQVKANLIGGIIFGLGWGLTGACSAPLFILVGLTWQIGLLLFGGALIGTFSYAIIKNKIPH